MKDFFTQQTPNSPTLSLNNDASGHGQLMYWTTEYWFWIGHRPIASHIQQQSKPYLVLGTCVSEECVPFQMDILCAIQRSSFMAFSRHCTMDITGNRRFTESCSRATFTEAGLWTGPFKVCSHVATIIICRNRHSY